MLKKKLGIEAIELDNILNAEDFTTSHFKIPSSLIIPEGCKKIGYRAFWGCRELEKVIIPESVKEIGEYSFAYCKKLREVVIPKNVEEIGKCAFCGCRELKKIVIPENVERIEDYVFYGCTDTDIILEKLESEFKFIASTAFCNVKNVKEEIRS